MHCVGEGGQDEDKEDEDGKRSDQGEAPHFHVGDIVSVVEAAVAANNSRQSSASGGWHKKSSARLCLEPAAEDAATSSTCVDRCS